MKLFEKTTYRQGKAVKTKITAKNSTGEPVDFLCERAANGTYWCDGRAFVPANGDVCEARKNSVSFVREVEADGTRNFFIGDKVTCQVEVPVAIREQFEEANKDFIARVRTQYRIGQNPLKAIRALGYKARFSSSDFGDWTNSFSVTTKAGETAFVEISE